jgi:predicted HTH domain antitoxin
MPKRLVLEFPVEFPEEGTLNKKALKKGKEAVVLELLREGKISQGKAAELLEISRNNLFDLMAKHDIPVMDMTEEELKEELSKDIFRK